MTRKSIILATALVAVLVVLGGGLYAYDHARADEVASGLRIGGVAIGGLSREQARARLERELLEQLSRPILVHHGKKTWRLGAREARIRADLDTVLDQAIARSRSDGLLTRSWRSLSGGRIEDDLRPTVDYSKRAVVRLLDKVRGSIERPASDATIKLTATGIERTPGKDGLAVRASELHRQIRAAITSPTASRRFVARTTHTRPKVTTEDLAERYDTVLIVNRKRFRLKLYKDLELAKTYKIAVGKVGLETPPGEYKIANKAINPAWHVPDSDWAGKLRGKVIAGNDPKNPIKARWMGIYDGVGIHGTSDDASIGSNASHGCIRMHIPDVEELYDEVPVGAPIYIA